MFILQRQWRYAATVIAILLVCTVTAKAAIKHDVASMNHHEIEEALQECPVVQSLNLHRQSTSPSSTSSFSTRLFALLFPSTKPAVNALLATLYISGPPNFLLALCPPNVDPSSLSIMVAFAVGGLLGDTLFHLLPEIFLGEAESEGVRFVMVDGKRNLLLGVAIMVGFVCFVALDKGLRIATGGEGHDHSHHAHGTPTVKSDDEKKTSANGTISSTTSSLPAPTDHSLRSRSTKSSTPNTSTPSTDAPSNTTTSSSSSTQKKSPFLPLIADFTHNITDGLALSSSFYASPTLGATTCFAVFFHEIPHEVGDFALLIAGGMDKRKAMAMQFVTALGAVLGTLIGICVQEFGGGGGQGASGGMSVGGVQMGLLGTGLSWGDLLLPWTAGTFLYVGTVAAIPEMLEAEQGKGKKEEVIKMGKQFAAMAVGAGVMLAISG